MKLFKKTRRIKPTVETIDDVYMDMIWKARFKKLRFCPECSRAAKFQKITDRKAWACSWCGYQIHPLGQTAFHKSATPLYKWAIAYLLVLNKPNITSEELQAHIGTTYKTAWRMRNTIRHQILNAKKANIKQI